MIEHLSAEQISQWITGDRPAELQHHVAECTECRTELVQMEAALGHFRAAMRDPGVVPAPVWRAAPARRVASLWPRLVLAAATLLVLIGGPVYWTAHERARQAEAAAQALSDTQLLERVSSAIAEPVPEPLEPLVTLVTWNASSADAGQKK
jgi:hypothetical protein